MGGADLRSVWRWNWIVPLNVHGEQLVIDLQGLFDSFTIHRNDPDHWRCRPDTNRVFSVKSCYATLLALRQVVSLDTKCVRSH
jgi:hypothetical protein